MTIPHNYKLMWSATFVKMTRQHVWTRCALCLPSVYIAGTFHKMDNIPWVYGLVRRQVLPHTLKECCLIHLRLPLRRRLERTRLAWCDWYILSLPGQHPVPKTPHREIKWSSFNLQRCQINVSEKVYVSQREYAKSRCKSSKLSDRWYMCVQGAKHVWWTAPVPKTLPRREWVDLKTTSLYWRFSNARGTISRFMREICVQVAKHV